jgi:hypothetical protein
MKDCTDLLEVYQGTHWADGYSTVEQVKEVHRGVGFQKWGWLVAEHRGKVVGEVIFRTEKNPVSGKVGIIKDIGVDVRVQKQDIGRRLTVAAEKVLRDKKAVRVVATTPPEAYNYWMKVKYFARGSLMHIKLTPKKIPVVKPRKVKATALKDAKSLPKSMKFSNIAYPGSLADAVRAIVDEGVPGKLFEFHLDGTLVGVGAVIKQNKKEAKIVADVTKKGMDHAPYVISKTCKAAVRMKVKSIIGLVAKDQLPVFTSVAKWKAELAREIPVTKLL